MANTALDTCTIGTKIPLIYAPLGYCNSALESRVEGSVVRCTKTLVIVSVSSPYSGTKGKQMEIRMSKHTRRQAGQDAMSEHYRLPAP